MSAAPGSTGVRATVHANHSGGVYYRIESGAVRKGHVVRANNRGQAFAALGITADRQSAWVAIPHRTSREAHQALERSLAS